jgi:hypothetical protein
VFSLLNEIQALVLLPPLTIKSTSFFVLSAAAAAVAAVKIEAKAIFQKVPRPFFIVIYLYN